MSDVIEVMANAAEQYSFDEGRYPGTKEDELKAALRAAEKAGWRLVPTRASGKQVNMLIAQELSHAFYERLIEAAPRPWADA